MEQFILKYTFCRHYLSYLFELYLLVKQTDFILFLNKVLEIFIDYFYYFFLFDDLILNESVLLKLVELTLAELQLTAEH